LIDGIFSCAGLQPRNVPDRGRNALHGFTASMALFIEDTK
jgi:small ligand-binding sensory domain FIST